MFSDFEKAFFQRNEIEKPVPKEIIEALSENLPEGFKYSYIGGGACGVTPTIPKLNFGMKVEIPEDIQIEFKPTTVQELMEFIYRTQRVLKVISDSDGCVTLNGFKFKIEDMVKFPLTDDEVIEWYIKPEDFQPPVTLHIEGGGITKDLKIQRQPYADMYKSLFENVDDGTFKISYILDEKEGRLNFTFKAEIEKSRKVIEILEGLKLYQACLNGKARFAGIDLSRHLNSKEDTAIDKAIEFWEKTYQLQNELNIEFNIEFPVTMDDAMWVERLYKSFIEQKSYKQYIKLESIRIVGTKKFKKEDVIDSKNIMVKYVRRSQLNIWGVKLDLYDVVGLFNLRVQDVVLVDKKFMEYDLLVIPITDEGIYQSTHHFISKEEADNYTQSVNELEDAEELTI